MAEQLANDALTTLASAIGASDTSLTVASATGFPTTGNFRIRIDNEILLVTAVAGTTFTVNRGQEGTTAAPHSAGATVAQVLTVEGLTQWRRDGWDLGHVKNTVANRPAAIYPGRLFLPTNGFAVYRDTGSAWDAWGPVFPLSPPDLNSFTWVNQGSATATNTNGGILLTDPATATTNIRILKRPAPATPYKITVGFIPTIHMVTWSQVGIGFRQSSSGKLETISLLPTSTSYQVTLRIARYNSATSFNTDAASVNIIPMPRFFQLEDDGTTLFFRWSGDGYGFHTVYSESRTTWFTTSGPDEVFLTATSENSTRGAIGHFISWKQE